MRFYTSVHRYRNELLVRGVDDGRRFEKRVRYRPSLFISSPEGDEDGYLDAWGRPVKRVGFDSMSQARQFRDEYRGVRGVSLHGMDKYLYAWIRDVWPEGVSYDPTKIRAVVVDIEVGADQGFPDIDAAEKPITAIGISLIGSGRFTVYHCTDYVPNRPDVDSIRCADEAELLRRFMFDWRSLSPDVVTGWNVELFDVPYLVNRIRRVLGDGAADALSPWGLLEDREIMSRGRTHDTYAPVGVSILDYQHLYKKFVQERQESYTLDNIATVELDAKKLDYSGYASLHDMYLRNPQLYIEYNVVDVELVCRLQEKKKLLELVYAIAYDARVTYQDALASVRPWDVILHNQLMADRVVVPLIDQKPQEREIVGGFVKDPQVGLHRWIVSLDLNSLYPHLIMQYNVSPEKKVTHEAVRASGEEGARMVADAASLSRVDIDVSRYRAFLAAHRGTLARLQLTCTPNGVFFDRRERGFLSVAMRDMYEGRAAIKDRMLEMKREIEREKDGERKRLLEIEAARLHNLQLAKKIQLNSAYGALTNRGFRWYDPDLGEAITTAGQVSIKFIAAEINGYLNGVMGTTDVDRVVAIDTDSVYVTLDDVLARFPADVGTEQRVDLVDRIVRQKLEPFIDGRYAALAEEANAIEQCMKMKRESIASVGIWTAKKRYILNVHDKEGVRYAKPKVAVTGIEAIKSSTPKVCREAIRRAFEIVMDGDKDALVDYVEEFRDRFKKMTFEEIAFPRGVNNLEQYSSEATVFKKGCPMHVKGALLYNHMVRTLGLLADRTEIASGDKIRFCYLRTPNKTGANVIASPRGLPPEFGLDGYIDHETQFEKAFIDPLQPIADAVGWRLKRVSSLEEFM